MRGDREAENIMILFSLVPSFTPEELAQLGSFSRERVLGPGAHFPVATDDGISFLKEGRLVFSGSSLILSVVEAGRLFGSTSASWNDRHLSARAIVPSRLLVIPRGRFARWLSRKPELARKLAACGWHFDERTAPTRLPSEITAA
jgi:CRP-like cAMP-binding protein